MNILVTGATGFIGSNLCRALLKINHEVFALSHSERTESVAPLLSHNHFHLLSGDIRSLPEMREIMESNKIDAVIHLAAYVTYGSHEASDNLTHLENNIKGTLVILQSCVTAGISKVIYASSRDVYGMPEYLPIDENHPTKPLTFYSLTKLQGESYCQFYAQNYNLHVAVLRYAGVYGPGKNRGLVHNAIRAVLRDQLPQIASDGNQTRDFVYVDDVVDATIKALDILGKTKFDIFNIGSGEEISANELLSKIIQISGAHIDFGYVLASSDDRFILDITKARRVLGYQPGSIDDGLGKFMQIIKAGEKSGNSVNKALL